MDTRVEIPFEELRIGMTCEDLNGDKWIIEDTGSFEEMCKKTHHSIKDYVNEDDTEYTLELATMNAVAASDTDNPDCIVPWVYDSSGVLAFKGEANPGDHERTKEVYTREILNCMVSGPNLEMEFSKETLSHIRDLASDPKSAIGKIFNYFIKAIATEIDG